MSVRILSVEISPSTITVGNPITITIKAEEATWNSLKTDFANWNKVKQRFSNWNNVLNYIYTEPVEGEDNVYTSDNYGLIDSNGNQICIDGGYVSQYSAETIDNFLVEVLRE